MKSLIRNRPAPPFRLLFLVLLLSLGAHPGVALEYKTELAPIEDSVLEEAARASSVLIELGAKPPDSLYGLYRRAQEDVERLQKALRSSGYYNGTVSVLVAGRPAEALPPADGEPAPETVIPVTIEIRPGKLYHLREIRITGGEALPEKLQPELAPKAPARAADIMAERDRLLNAVLAQGYPFASVNLEPAVVDHEDRSVSVHYVVDSGPPATLGDIRVKGLDRVDADFVNRRVAKFEGRSYAPSEIASLRDDLRSLDVFESVKITTAERVDEAGRLPVDIEVIERDRRFIGFGANYSTNDGAGAKAYWGHRNLFGGAERLRLDADISGLGENELSEPNYGVSADFAKPDFLSEQQTLRSNLALVQEYDSETFDRKAATLTLGLERRLSDTLNVSFGGEAEISRITDDGVTRNFELFGPTGAINYDTSNDLLNPTKGVRLGLTGAAFPEVIGSSQDVFQTRAAGSSYLDLSGSGNLVLAGRLSVASVFGGSIDELPQDRLLYAGGGGSVRGYEFRSISPLDEDGDPTGGRSLVEGSIEVRYRFLEDYGIVPFFDAGTVTEEVFPSFNEDVQYAAGLGFRYYSPIGPIRADVAVPLNPREDDDPVAFYISIGQAF
ncbi:autotransporter assembly complex protein TamA [Dongia deserti]|uniref:autotransporter assembly complex protein TamA n=1 Tax=Dongia deserti TaxID=2268030 RepID=UPI000E646B8F|nr:autotransporter assembly complex family protein [Dongia deserti]